jgi:hypothetical protein
MAYVINKDWATQTKRHITVSHYIDYPETVEEWSLKSRSEPTEISSIRRRGVKCQSFADGGFRMSGGRWQDQRRESSPTPVLCSLKLGTLVTADRTIPKVNLLLQLTRTVT